VVWTVRFAEEGYFEVEIREGVDLGLMPRLLEDLARVTREKQCYRLLIGLFFQAGSESFLDLKLGMDLWNLRHKFHCVQVAILRPEEFGITPMKNFDFLKKFVGGVGWEFKLFETTDPAREWLLGG
jgi:hypothetical protein